MPPSPSIYPRTYLLNIYSAAVANGHIYIHPISEQASVGLRQSIYRLRRRYDKTAALYIPEEYHLVTVGDWSPDNGGTLPVYYTSGMDMPAIHTVDGEIIQSSVPSLTKPEPSLPPSELPEPSPSSASAFDIDGSPIDDLDDYLAKLQASAKTKDQQS